MEEKTPSASRVTEGWVVLDGEKSMKLWCSCYFTCTGICHELNYGNRKSHGLICSHRLSGLS